MQTAELLRNAAQALGVAAAKMDEVLKWQTHLAQEFSRICERLARLEKGEEWSGEERRRVDQRLETGDWTFKRIEELAKDADRTAAEARRTAADAKRMLSEVLQRKADGTRRKSKWVEVLKVAAPYIWAAVSACAAWIAARLQGGG